MSNAFSKFLRISEPRCTQLLLDFAAPRCLRLPTYEDTIAARRRIATEKFIKNKKSDEYYTRGITWYRFLETHGLVGGTFWEPFWGDGSCADVLRGYATLVGKEGDFWDHVLAPDRPTHMILSNPPFSFKWLVIETLCELRQDFALILGYQAFYKHGLQKMRRMEAHFGGTWEFFSLTAKEQLFYHPPKQCNVAIGCKILYVRF
jgi:hypothetical protein